MTGRRGALVHAIGALDIALWDICGKAEGVPCWQLWGEARGETLTPYASLQPEVSSFDAYLESMVEWAAPRARSGLHGRQARGDLLRARTRTRASRGPTTGSSRSAREVREAAGPDMTLMVDVQYAFDSVERALRVRRARSRSYDIFFLETPLWIDDLDGYASSRRRSPVRDRGRASGSRRGTSSAALIERSAVHVVQPDIGRVGGLTEARRVVRHGGGRAA